jgi:hypothetical protein
MFQNPHIAVYQSNSLDQALAAVDGSEDKKIFVFDETGRVTERKKTLRVQ